MKFSVGSSRGSCKYYRDCIPSTTVNINRQRQAAATGIHKKAKKIKEL